jgi:hypothetical protein
MESSFLTETLRNESMEIVNKLETIIYGKFNGYNNIYKLLLENLILIIDSHWDLIKPKSISLYDEQKEIIHLVISNLDKKILTFYEMPPANGKTVLSAILAKIICTE